MRACPHEPCRAPELGGRREDQRHVRAVVGEAKLTQLTVLAESPRDGAAEALAGLDHGSGRAAGPDRSALEGRFLWIRSPGRISDSPLTPARLEKALGVTGTARNLATVRVLAGMA